MMESTNNLSQQEPEIKLSHENEAFECEEEPGRDGPIRGGSEETATQFVGIGSDFRGLKEERASEKLPIKIQIGLNGPSPSHTDLSSASSTSGYDSRSEHFTIKWSNLDYVHTSSWYDLKSQRKLILNGLSGCFKSGELSAVLGPSGAGKSTFIDCLLGKREKGLTGKTRVVFEDPQVERERRSKRPLKIATIPQEDHLMESLTVTETFMFASRIKNAHLTYEDEQPMTVTKSFKSKPFDHFSNVQRVIKQLDLASCANLRCGSLSGGQYKRVSIGQELLSCPDLMILDEPTSGLDSVTCYQTISALRDLIDSSAYKLAIVVTIHQPDNEVFDLFHKAYVLASGGRAIYEGSTRSIVETVKMGLDRVEVNRKRMLGGVEWKNYSIDCQSKLDVLRERLSKPESLNPARLIVELAANKFGFEVTSAMNEIQKLHSTDSMDSLDDTYSSSSASSISLAPSVSNNTNNDTKKFELSKQISLTTTTTSAAAAATGFDYNLHDPQSRKASQDKLLSVVAANVNQRRSFKVYFKHLFIHCQRSWLTIVRDPMLFSLQVLLHILVPLLISYSFQGYRGDACPKVGPLDVINEAYRFDGNVLDDLQRELRVVFENLGYMFFQIYVIIFAAVCVTSLTYPLIMHVLLKEYRNGWYSMSSYFIGRTLADLPVPTFNVFLAMAISYHLTGQPLSPYGWRFLSVTLITVLATLVAQTQGLMFGALLMNMPQSAVFVAPASTAPLVVVSGFLIRIQSLPMPLQILSKFSYFTHLLNGFIISRYGFNRCPCKDEDFSINDSHIIPTQASGIMNIWVETFAQDFNHQLYNSTTKETANVDLIDKLVSTITMAKTFGYNITNCDQIKPFTMLDYQLEDSDLKFCFIILIVMLFAFRWLTYITLSWKINSCL